MNRIVAWLNDSFAPTMQGVVRRPWIAAVSSAMQKNLPFILTGSLIFLYGVFRDFFPALPDLWIIAANTFGLLGLITAFMIANQVMEKLQHHSYSVTAGITSIAVYQMFTLPTEVDGFMMIPAGRYGPTGILVGIIVGLIVAFVFNIIVKMKLLEDSNVPDFVVNWINNIIPILISVGGAAIVTVGLNFDMFAAILDIFSPIQRFGQTLPGFILIVFIPNFFYSIGVSNWLFTPLTTTIFMAGIAANIELAANGMTPVNIVTNETVYTAGLITMGGMGATLTLNLMMLLSKSKSLKAVGRICMLPSIFNINEPIVYGAPIVMNPMLMLPMWINSIVGPVIVWIVMRVGLLKIPAKMIQVGQIPAPFSTVMITEDWRGVIVYAVMFVIFFAVWYPFFKVFENQKLEEERAAVNEN